MKNLLHFSLVIVTALLISNISWGQTTITSDGFENTLNIFSSSGTIGYMSGNSASGDRPATSPFKTESTYGLGVTNNTATLTSNAINTSSYSSISCNLKIAAFSIGSTGNGMETGDYIQVEISPDNGTNYYLTAKVTGSSSNNAYWAFSATGTPSYAYDGTNQTSNITSAANTGSNTNGPASLTITDLPSVTQLKIKIILKTNDSKELWVIDDFTVTGTAAVSSYSGVTSGSGSEPATISSLTNTQGAASMNFDFLVTDDANISGGNDALPTLISQIVISQGTGNDVSDWTQAIQGAELSDGTNSMTGTINSTNITFSSINTANLGNVSDGGTKTYTIKVWLKSSLGGSLPTTIDGLNLAFIIDRTSFTTSGSSTAFESGGGTAVESGSSNNAVTVVATKLTFTTQPPSTAGVSANLSTSPVVTAQDANNNTDKDFTYPSLSVTNSASLTTSNSPTGSNVSNGVLTFPSNFQFTQTGTTTLSVTATGVTGTGASSSITVSIAPVTILTFDFAGASGDETSLNSNSNDANLNSSTITRGSGLTASANGDRFNATNWSDISIADAVTNNDYMQIVITPNSGYQFSVTSIDINLQRSNTGPSKVSVRNSLDGYASDLDGQKTITDNISTQTFTFTFSQSASAVAVTYRFYMYAESTGGSGGIGDGSGDDIVVKGNVTPACTPPSAASSVSASNVTSGGFDVSWTAGGGDGTMIVVTKNSVVSPTSGTTYTANTSWASAGQINTDNRVVFRSSGSSVTGISGLTSETQYTVTAYEYDNTGDCYNVSSPPSTTQWTLSTEPGSHAASFSGTSPSYDQIDLSFSAASTISNADGYIILQKTGSTPTGTPSDATGYTVGNTIGDATVAAIINSTSATTQSITNLTGSTTYYFTLIPFNWNGSNTPTYNYRTAATIPSTNVTTLVTPAMTSDIIFNSSSPASQNQNIAYFDYQGTTLTNTGTGSNGSIGVMGITVRDFGGDALPTILTGVTFSVTGVANIRSARLFNGNSPIGTAVSVNGTSPIVFTSLSESCANNSTLALNLRVTFLGTVTDKQKMVFTITSATAASGSTSSLFAAADAGGAVSENTGGDINRIQVTADRIGFVTQPTQTPVNTDMSTVTVEGKDALGNRDIDYTGSIDITSDGTMSPSPRTATASSGLATWSTGNSNAIVHTAQATGRQLTATTTGLGYSNTTTSNLFNIDNTPANSYRTTSAGTWKSDGSGTATWERLISGVWTSNSSPAFNSSNNIYIRHYVSITGSASPANIIIENNGKLTNSSSCTYGTSLLVQKGGILQVNASLTVSGTFEVKDSADVNINFEFGNPSTSIWSGTENFHPKSNFVFQDWDCQNDDLITSNTTITTNTYNGYTAAFGNIILDFGSNLGSSDDWIMLSPDVTINMAHGNLIFRTNAAANSADMRISTTGTVTSGIGGNFIVEDTYIGAVFINFKTSETLDFTIKGDMQLDAGTTRIMAGSVAGSSSTVTVEGNINITSSAVLDMNSTSAEGPPPPIAILNLKGDLAVSSGGLLQNSNDFNLGLFNFNGTGDGSSPALTQTIDIASTSSNENRYMKFSVKKGAYVQQINRDFELGKNSGLVVDSAGVYDFGFNGSTALLTKNSGSQTGAYFTSSQSSTLKITSPDGISTTTGVGNVQVAAANRTYTKPAIYWYIGKENQMMGNVITTGGNTNNSIISELSTNSITLTPNNNIGISNTTSPFDALGGKLDIRKGIVIETSSATISGSGRLIMTDGTFRTSVTGVTLPQLSNYSNYSLTGGTVELNGTGNQTLRGSAPSYYNVKISGSNTLGTNKKNVTSSVTINNKLEITEDGIFDTDVNGVTGNAGLTMSSNGRWRISKTSNTTLPELLGVSTPYSLTGGTFELYGSTSGGSYVPQLIRGTANNVNVTYYNIVINATSMNMDNGNVGAQASFSVSNSLTVNSPAILILGVTDYVEGSGSFTINSNAGLYYGNVNGIKTGSGTVRATDGNVLVTGTKSFGLATYGFVSTNTTMESGNGLPATVKNLYVLKTDASHVVNLTNSVTINDTLALSKGIVTTGVKNVIVADTAASSIIALGSNIGTNYTNSYINGNLTRYFRDSSSLSYHFPVGNATKGRLATVKSNYLSGKTIQNPNGIGKFTAYFKDGPVTTGGFQSDQYLSAWETSIPGVPHTAYKRMRDEGTWIIEPDSTVSQGTYDISLFFNGFNTPSELKDNQFGILKREVGSTTFADWKPAGGSLSVASGPGRLKNDGYALRKGLSSFSEFGIGETDNLLPIQLTTFTAEKCNDDLDALLKWNTASELNNDRFDIELALDIKGELTFSKIGEVKGAGTSIVGSNYSFIDRQLNKSGNRYYRLKQIDFDGSYEFSEVRVLNFNSTKLEVSTMYPNPTDNILNFVVSTPYIKSVTISVVNIIGQEIFMSREELMKGVTTLRFDVSTLAQGVYFLNVKDGRDVNIHRKFEKF